MIIYEIIVINLFEWCFDLDQEGDMKHNSGYWYQFMIPRIITIGDVKIYRWLNFYFRLGG